MYESRLGVVVVCCAPRVRAHPARESWGLWIRNGGLLLFVELHVWCKSRNRTLVARKGRAGCRGQEIGGTLAGRTVGPTWLVI